MKKDLEKSTSMSPKKHGILLTIFMIVTGFGSVSSIVNLNPATLRILYGEVQWWMYLYVIWGMVSSAIILFGIWKWKKWAIYVFVLNVIIALLMQIFVLPNYANFSLITIVLSLVVSAFWFWVIYRKWSHFE